MAFTWSKEQKEVLDARGENLLVRASAGSGKTAVLVARILALLTDQEKPQNIDRFLIVTFTRAAAAELKERIRKALSEALAKDPENEHLLSQTFLIHNAQITTIDGFCTNLLREHAHLCELDPAFRIAEEGEIKLLKEDVMDELMLQLYEGEAGLTKEEVADLVESFSTDKNDRSLRTAIGEVFAASESHPWPARFFADCRKNNAAESFSKMEQTSWMQALYRDADSLLAEGRRLSLLNIARANEQNGPASYLPVLEADAAFFEALLADADYETRRARLFSDALMKLPSTRAASEEEKAIRKQIQTDRATIKKDIIEQLQAHVYAASAEETLALMQKSGAVLDRLLTVAEHYAERFAAAKRKKKIADFADLEHFALRLLRNEDGTKTPLARELSKYYATVMVDEYQDSNFLQEALLSAVSGIEEGRDNYFCVGDIKQSIYSFRNAEPELFLEKGEAYTAGEGRCIDLRENFRSRDEVTESVNQVFRQIMRADLGGISYDDKAALLPKAAYPDAADGRFTTELLLVSAEEEMDEEVFISEEEPQGKIEIEARAVAERIEALLQNETIYDQELQAARKIKGSDIAILLRTVKGYAEIYADALRARGIDAYTTQQSAYFDAQEVLTMLDFLTILHNPLQDIPFAAVLSSPIVGLTAEELGRVRMVAGAPALLARTAWQSMYDCACLYAGLKESEATAQNPLPKEADLAERLRRFLLFYEDLRESVPYTPIHELLWRMMTESGYLDYARALPGGLQRAANLRMLIDKAIAYEQTSYVGLFNFIRYIRQLRKVDQDFGEAQISTENENAVKISSIHKSKGLEYPIVIVASCAKQFNLSDANARLQIDRRMGLAMDYVDYEKRTRTGTVKRFALSREKKAAAIGEELRVLYVAMTRAKQKLILTGLAPKEEKMEEKMNPPIALHEEVLPRALILRGKSYLDWLLPAVCRAISRSERKGDMPAFLMRQVQPSALVLAAVHDEADLQMRLATLRNLDAAQCYDADMREAIRTRFAYHYPYADLANLPVKLSVSALKKGAMPDEEAEELYPAEEIVPFIPSFAKDAGNENTAFSGAFRGTAYHECMRFMRLDALQEGADETAFVEAEMARLLAERKLSEEQLSEIDAADIARFLRSDLGKRMRAAAKHGMLYREQPFVLRVSADRIDSAYPADETVLVQGIIDAYFIEDDQLVLLDYKSDRVRDIKELAARYQLQLAFYAEALHAIRDQAVKEIYIWSFHKKEEIRL